MFKSVEYTNFDGQPELHQLAERATAVLAGLIRSWRDEVQVTWQTAPPGSGAILELTLVLDLPNASHSASGLLRRRDFEPGEEELLRMNLREVWLDVLDLLIAKMSADLEESSANPVEV
jgi:hypothetical protein